MAIAAAASVNFVNAVTIASLTAPDVTADVLSVTATSDSRIVAASGGLAYSKSTADTQNLVIERREGDRLAGAFSWNEIEAATDASVLGSGSLSATLRSIRPPAQFLNAASPSWPTAR